TSPRLRVAETRHPGACLRDSRLQVGGRITGRGCLGGMLLGLAQLGDGGGQGDEWAMSAMAISVLSPVRFPASADRAVPDRLVVSAPAQLPVAANLPNSHNSNSGLCGARRRARPTGAHRSRASNSN